MTNKSQAAFEEWYGYYGFSSDWSKEHGCYQDKQTQFMFSAWQASRESLKQELMSEEMVEKIAETIRYQMKKSSVRGSKYDNATKAALQVVVEGL